MRARWTYHPLPRHCQACGTPLMTADAQLDERRQVFDIPIARYQVTEHRTRQLRCTCGQLHQSQFPEGVTEVVQYGPNVRALAVHLTEGQLLPLGRSAQLITQLFALKLSPATVLAWIGEASARLRPNVERIAHDAPVAHADKSGLRVADIEIDYIDNVGIQIEVSGQTLTPGFEVCGIYRLKA